jgi:uncharacterized protein YndB with AHSA1/START domain
MTLQAIATEYPVVHLDRTYNVSAARMFEAWTKAEALGRWFGPEGVTCDQVSVDLRVGGVMTLTMTMSDGAQTTLKTVYREIVPNQRLVFTWQWLSPSCEGSREVDGETLVTVDFIELGENKTRVSILHEGLPTETARESHARGWNGSLDCLQNQLFQ